MSKSPRGRIRDPERDRPADLGGAVPRTHHRSRRRAAGARHAGGPGVAAPRGRLPRPGPRVPEGRGRDRLRRLGPAHLKPSTRTPAPLRPHQGPRPHRPHDPGDLLLHLRANRMDLCYELADRILARLTGAVTVADETHGFGYFDSRDLLGFVDGTENPEGADAAAWAYASAAQEPDFPGGSYVVVQKYLHDRAAWNALSVEEQEGAIGRTKLEDIELDDDAKPANAHIALTVIEDADGNELKIVRHNMPFFRHSDRAYGTYFIGYAADPAITEQMLRNMFLGTGEASHDRILDFSTAMTGGLFFVPPAPFLDDLPPMPGS
ncbi:Dyp-type peroxidase [Nonomuraea sp. NPDC050153]|uniref:Dyp-type peroxidase n=1 Tax=Nonomuraea sp. NPDC050153 TaxID=3364359 RepID=UPI0037B57585